jgi:hypothetical protein
MTAPSQNRPAANLQTAIAVSDPVLARIETPAGRIVLLAEDARQDIAAEMQLHAVRCVRAEKGVMARLRRPRVERYAEVRLRRWIGGRYLAEVAGTDSTLAISAFSFPLKNLSAAEFERLAALPPKRLLATARRLLAGRVTPMPSRTLLQRLRQAVGRRVAAAV